MQSLANPASKLTDLQRQNILDATISVLFKIDEHKKSCSDPHCHVLEALRA